MQKIIILDYVSIIKIKPIVLFVFLLQEIVFSEVAF